MKRFSLLSLSALLLVATLGCAGQRPPWAPPGTVEQQRLRAAVHDPYTDNDLGPRVDGGRPREYERPLPEAVRNNSLWERWWGG